MHKGLFFNLSQYLMRGGVGEGVGGGGVEMECFSFAHRVLIMTFMVKLGLNVSRGGFLLVPLPPF